MRHSKIFLIALLVVPMAMASASAQELSTDEGGKVFVSIARNNNISGKVIGLDSLKVNTEFGEVAIPMSKIDGIKMHCDAKDNAVIAFKNGDLVTGKVVLETVKLKTRWGTAHVNTEKVETITLSENSRFYSDTSTGKAVWRFSKTSRN